MSPWSQGRHLEWDTPRHRRFARAGASVVLADFKKDVVGHAFTVDGDDCALNSEQSGPASDKMDM